MEENFTVRKKKFKSGSVIYFFHLINAHVMELSLAGVRFLNNDSKISTDVEDKIKKLWTESKSGLLFGTLTTRIISVTAKLHFYKKAMKKLEQTHCSNFTIFCPKNTFLALVSKVSDSTTHYLMELTILVLISNE